MKWYLVGKTNRLVESSLGYLSHVCKNVNLLMSIAF